MPKVTLEVVIGINNVMRDALRSSELDLVIGPVKGRDDTEFVTHILLDDEVVVSACKDRPLLKRAVTLKEMGRYHWILPARPATQRQRLDDTFIAHRLPPPEVQIQTNSLYLLPDLIVRTHLLSFTPRRHLWPQRSYAALREVGLAATTMTRNFGVMYREHAYLSPAAHRVVAPFLAE
jgi:DNA-binding transcriptional LysR family regulator